MWGRTNSRLRPLVRRYTGTGRLGLGVFTQVITGFEQEDFLRSLYIGVTLVSVRGVSSVKDSLKITRALIGGFNT